MLGSGGVDNPVTPEINDRLAMLLNEDWRKFAYEVLTDYQIQRIDMDNSTVYEKCFEMLKLWNQQSQKTVVNSMVIEILKKLKRNDILLSLADSFPSFRNIQYLRTRNVNRQSPEAISQGIQEKGILLKDLRMLTKDELASKLDNSSGIGMANWKSLAHELIDKEDRHRINDLELHYYGGGNPALEFLKQLAIRNPLLTVDKFRSLCSKFKRMDIVLYIDSNLSKNEELRYINTEHRERIASYLNLNIPSVYNWEIFAEEYGFKSDDTRQIRSLIREGQSYSPTKKLFELLGEVHPHMTVETMKKACKKLGRNDIVFVLDNVIV